MRQVDEQIPTEEVVKSSATIRLSTKRAWSEWARLRWGGRDIVSHAERELKLTTGGAKGLAYATISQRVIDQIIDNAEFGLEAEIEVAALRRGMTPEQFITAYLQRVQGRAEDERKAQEAASMRAASILARLHNARPFGRRRDLAVAGG